MAQSTVLRSNRNMTVFDEKAISEMKNMATFRQYKRNGLFSNKVLSTCPSFPKFHAAHGEPLVRVTEEEESARAQNFKSISEQSIKLMGRLDFIEISEKTKEVFVRDDFGIYVLHECALQDMKFLELELMKVCSFFIHKSELLEDPSEMRSNYCFPSCDRLQVIDDVLQREADF